MSNEMKPKKSECTVEKEQLSGPDTSSAPHANVDRDGHCTVPADAESVRFDTGDPCIDGLNWPKAGDDVSISTKDGSLENKGK